jgi:hypothetical protein
MVWLEADQVLTLLSVSHTLKRRLFALVMAPAGRARLDLYDGEI